MAKYDIWDPNRAVLDDEANNSNNRNDRGKPHQLEERFQYYFDDVHHFEKYWQTKYPMTGMPPVGSPDYERYWTERPKLRENTGRKITFKAAYE